MNILVAIPFMSSLHPHFYQLMIKLSDALIEANPDFDIDLARNKDNSTEKLPGIFGNIARARNALIDKYLCAKHEYVLWIDADIIDYPADLLTRLYKVNLGITAPLVLIEGTSMFYDTYGFIEHGECVSCCPPYFESQNNVVDLDAVGCSYLIPASIYRLGARYADTPGRTDHESIMKVARDRGIRIVCDRETVIYHADLPRYGLNWHGH